ncbi:MAG TPA: TonB-dependent receptor [Burkholderiales bacterium]|nr:TonB-dependent receptor [Burkholderiales bacterium]
MSALLALSALHFVAIGTTQADEAEDPEAEPEAPYVEHIVVTGTRITRRDYESASPIVTVMPELFESIGAPTVEDALNRLPQLVPNFSGTSNNPGNDGQAFIDLRGLGPQATLVLLDGRRLTPANGLGVVDVNLIPPTLIEQVEIVSGGASAVYGSDAVAGVVNFRLRDSFEGVELGGRYGRTDRGDGDQWDVHLTAGTLFAGGRGSVYGFVGRSERKLVTQGDRSFSRYALGYVGPGQGTLGPDDAFVARGSVVQEYGAAFLPVFGPNPVDAAAFDALFTGYGAAPGSVPLQTFIGFNNDGTLFAVGNGAPGSVANFRGDADPVLFNDRRVTYNFAPPNALQLPLERSSAFGRLQFDLGPMARLYADALYADYGVTQQLAPTPGFITFMPRHNPFVPDDLAFLLDSRPDPDADFIWFKRFSEIGPRVAENEYGVHQLTVGADGYVFLDWRFDVYAQYGANDQTQRQSGNALVSRMEELTFAPDGGVAACGGFDVFGLGSIPAECAIYIAADGSNDARAKQWLGEASIEGPLADLPAGELRAALGVFHKREAYSYRADPIATTILPDGREDLVGFNASDDIDGDERNTDLYAEVLVPLLSGRPGVHALEAGFGYRHAEYRTAGGADALKAELFYRPIESLLLRGSFQNAVRAPSVFELLQPQLPTFFSLNVIDRDPCEAASAARNGPDAAAVEALCLAQGVPAELLPDLQHPFNLFEGFRGGNPDLEPEEAESWTLGLAWSPARDDARLGRMQASLDWYRIEVEEAIQWVSGEEVVTRCFDPAVNPEFSPEQQWCTFFSRDPATGEIVDAFGINRNIGRVTTSGVDLQLDWRLPLGPGTVGANWLVSWLDYYRRDAGAGAPVDELSGRISFLPGTSLPEWKWLLSLDYAWRGASVTARTRYIGEMRSGTVPEFEIPRRVYLDLYASYDFGSGAFDGLRLGLGIENLADRDPPIFPDGAANTDPQQYDVLGRRYFASLSYRF